ncbi:MAG TPA: MFS transporter [Gemmataceae bacterium]|jgi:MFS family permease|nr:MFS transporter [Gemmataceae bacterium]
MNRDASTGGKWLTRNVLAIGMLSLFSDIGHELTTAILPLYLATLGGGAIALGVIEGCADAASSLIKLWMSHHSDRIGKRKPILLIGYLATALIGSFAFATNWWQILVIRVLAWMGRGARGPVKDALLSESVPAAAHGRAFGFERAMDTVGAIIGPAIGLSLIGIIALPHIFLIAFIPGAITVLIVIFGLRELPRQPQPGARIVASLQELPGAFYRYVAAVGVFGLGNFAHTLLVLHAVRRLTPEFGEVTAGKIGVALFIFHNILYAAVSYPAGMIGDRFSKKTLLAIGYALFGIMCLGFIVAGSSLVMLAVLFALAGIYVGIVDAMEKALAADLLPVARRATGYGVLATVNSFGDLLSSILVGLLWHYVSAPAGFFYGAALTLLGAAALAFVPSRGNEP